MLFQLALETFHFSSNGCFSSKSTHWYEKLLQGKRCRVYILTVKGEEFQLNICYFRYFIPIGRNPSQHNGRCKYKRSIELLLHYLCHNWNESVCWKRYLTIAFFQSISGLNQLQSSTLIGFESRRGFRVFPRTVLFANFPECICLELLAYVACWRAWRRDSTILVKVNYLGCFGKEFSVWRAPHRGQGHGTCRFQHHWGSRWRNVEIPACGERVPRGGWREDKGNDSLAERSGRGPNSLLAPSDFVELN